MTVKKKFDKAEELRSFIEQNRSEFDKIYVKEIYNLGDTPPSGSPLFIYSGYSIIMAYLSEGTLFLNIYDKDFFIRNIRGGVFREEPDSEEFYYVYFPGSKLINSFVQDIEIKETENGGIESVDLDFKDGQHLSVNHSDSLKGTMNAFVYG
ncbi:MAG: hypothetical protein J6J07_08840 [Oscillospiraceae bacterium]|nr:hypothetical protein [Oscillospiraceae bacterium]